MMKVLEQATKVLCLAEEACDKTTKGNWQSCTYQKYRWRMDQEVEHLYALFGGPEEEEVRVKGQRLAKEWLAKARDSTEEARRCMSLQLRGASKLNAARQCRHDGLPTESRPCEEQARIALQRADYAWESGPRRMRELCGEYPDRAGWPTGGSVAVKAPDGGSGFSPGSTDSESDTECSESCDPGSSDPEMGDSKLPEAESEGFGPPEAEPEGSESSESESSGTESEDSDSSEAESVDSNPFDMEARRRGPLTFDSSDSDSSSSSDSEESNSCSADSGFAKPSSSDTEGDLTPSAPPLEEIEELGRTVIGLSGRAMRQVRRLLTMLTQMRKDLPPSARTEAVRRLGWRLGPGRKASRASMDDSGPEPTQAPEGGDQRKFVEEWWRMRREGEERYKAARNKAARPDDSLACAEERLATKRAAELEERAKVIEQQLPVITARLSVLWNEMTGSSGPLPSEIQLTSTGTEMTTEEHVATAETHLRYAEGHLRPSEEHLADAEVHLKLVKAHLAALVAMESSEADPPEAATLPPA
jgi:hypothetical protein